MNYRMMLERQIISCFNCLTETCKWINTLTAKIQIWGLGERLLLSSRAFVYVQYNITALEFAHPN